MAIAEVRPHLGAPALWIDGTPSFPLLMMTTPQGLRELQQFGLTGTHLYTTETLSWWTGAACYDFTAADAAMQALLAVDPQALLIPRIVLDAPQDWMATHPEELVQYGDPAAYTDEANCWGGAQHPSWASIPWRQTATEALRALLRHAKEASWGASVIGWHIGCGVYGEWHYCCGPFHPDISRPFMTAYADWLRRRDPSFAGAPILPDPSERAQGDWAAILDPSRRQWQLDYATFFHELGADLLAHFARVIKEETAERALVVAFNGYMPELGVSHETDHRAFDRALRNSDVEIYASPHTYRRRAPGDDGAMRGFLGSVQLHGRLWLDEEDDRTYLAPDQYQKAYKHVGTLEESVEILWRGFAQALTHACGLWYMDQGAMWYDDAFPYYRHPAFVTAFERMRRIGEESMQRPRRRQSEVALICDPRSAFHLTDPDGEAHISLKLYAETIRELTRCGLPYDVYLLTDLLSPDMPAYKSYVFLDAVYLTDAEAAVIRALRDGGSQLGFYYAAGIASDAGLSLARMCDMLGMPLTFADTPAAHPSWLPMLLSPAAPNGVVEAERTWYCPHPPLAAGELRRLFRAAGAHVYLESDDTLFAGGGYLGLHAAGAGTKTLRLPQPATWTNARSGEIVARDADQLTTTARFGETLLFALE